MSNQLTLITPEKDVSQWTPEEQNQIDARRIALLKEDIWSIQHMINPSEVVKLAAVQMGGCVIEYCINPSKELQFAAVQEDGTAIRYIKDASEELKQTAVKAFGWAIANIPNPSEEVKAIAKGSTWAKKYPMWMKKYLG